MIATYVPAQLTLVARDVVCAAMGWALGKVPDAVTALAVAQWALETGRGKSCHNYNPGNLKAGEQYVGMYTCFRCNEIIKGARRWFSPEGETDELGDLLLTFKEPVPPGHPQTRFRAYPNIFDGCLAYVGFLQRPRYAAAWQAMFSGNPGIFVHALKTAGYFTADEAPYAKAIVSLHGEFLAVLENRPAPELPVDEGLQRLIAYADSFLFDPIEEDRTPVVT